MQILIIILYLHYMNANRRNFRVVQEIGSWNTMSTPDFRPEVEIAPFCARTMKNMQYNPYLWPNCRNVRVLDKLELRNTMVTSDLRPEDGRFVHAQCIRP